MKKLPEYIAICKLIDELRQPLPKKNTVITEDSQEEKSDGESQKQDSNDTENCLENDQPKYPLKRQDASRDLKKGNTGVQNPQQSVSAGFFKKPPNRQFGTSDLLSIKKGL